MYNILSEVFSKTVNNHSLFILLVFIYIFRVMKKQIILVMMFFISYLQNTTSQRFGLEK